MLIKFARLLCLVTDIHEAKRKKGINGPPLPDTESGENSMSLNSSFKSKGSFVRIVHRGGRQELYPCALQASQLMQKYPGTCVAKPEVFKNPHESVLRPEAKLLPGEKYFIIPSTAVKKLQRKHLEKANGRGSDEEIWDDVSINSGEINFEESVFSANEFYAPKKQSPKSLSIRGIRKKKPFLPPLPKARAYKGPGWEPSLTSIKELSP